MPQTLVIDTDPGLDDAVAILFALAHPALEVIGLTTVGGNVGLARTTRNAQGLVALVGRDLPVTAGAERPLVRPAFTGEPLHGADGIGGIALPAPARPAGTGAAGWLADTLAARPEGSVTLCALGPLTNVARLIATAPDAARRLAGIVAMGGVLEAPGNAGARAEFNFAADAEAARAVLAAGLPTTLIPLDVTRQVRARPDDTARLAAGPGPARMAGALIDAYFAARSAESRPLHDPLVPLFLVRPELFEMRETRCDVDLARDPGALVPGDLPVRVATGIDAEAARETLIATLAQAGSSCSTSATQKATPAGMASSQKS